MKEKVGRLTRVKPVRAHRRRSRYVPCDAPGLPASMITLWVPGALVEVFAQ